MNTEMRAVFRVFLRSLLIQGSWNYRTLLGTGMAWALLPFASGGKARIQAAPGSAPEAATDSEVSRESARGMNSPTGTPARPPVETEGLWIARMAEPFNAHPFLAPVAIGALARVGQEGADPERVRTFRNALRGPLGGLGDQFVWSAWRPFCVVAALVTGALGAPAWAVVTLFLLLWNVVHLSLRFRAAGIGITLGFGVADAIRALNLPRQTERIAAPGVLGLGLLFGLVLMHGAQVAGGLSNGSTWFSGAAFSFLLGGLAGGAALSRWSPVLLLFLAAAVTWLIMS